MRVHNAAIGGSIHFTAGGLWYFDYSGQFWYPVLGGAYLGLSAGFLWSVAGM